MPPAPGGQQTKGAWRSEATDRSLVDSRAETDEALGLCCCGVPGQLARVADSPGALPGVVGQRLVADRAVDWVDQSVWGARVGLTGN